MLNVCASVAFQPPSAINQIFTSAGINVLPAFRKISKRIPPPKNMSVRNIPTIKPDNAKDIMMIFLNTIFIKMVLKAKVGRERFELTRSSCYEASLNFVR